MDFVQADLKQSLQLLLQAQRYILEVSDSSRLSPVQTSLRLLELEARSSSGSSLSMPSTISPQRLGIPSTKLLRDFGVNVVEATGFADFPKAASEADLVVNFADNQSLPFIQAIIAE